MGFYLFDKFNEKLGKKNEREKGYQDQIHQVWNYNCTLNWFLEICATQLQLAWNKRKRVDGEVGCVDNNSVGMPWLPNSFSWFNSLFFFPLSSRNLGEDPWIWIGGHNYTISQVGVTPRKFYDFLIFSCFL